MTYLRTILIAFFLFFVNLGLTQEVQHNKETYYVSGTSVFKAGENVTETLSNDDKKNIFSQLKANAKLQKEEEKALAKAKKEAKATEKQLKQSEKALKKEQKLIKAKEKAQSQLRKAQSNLAKEQKKFDKLKRKDKLTPETRAKFEKNVLKLKAKVQKTQLELREI